METTYRFDAFNTESLYGFGTQSEAEEYLDWMNANREFNRFEVSIAELSAEQADTLAFNLRDALNDIADSLE